MTDSTQSYVDPQRLGIDQDDSIDAVLHRDQTWRLPTSGGITSVAVNVRTGTAQSVGATANDSALVLCNAGEVSIGGGFTTTGVQVLENGSSRSSTDGWTVRVRNQQGSSQNYTPFVVCLAVT